MDTNIVLCGLICGFFMGIIGMDKIGRFLWVCLVLVTGIIELLAIIALQPFCLIAFCGGYAFGILRNAFKSGMRRFD